MLVEFGIMSNKWSVEADDKLVCYAAILIYLGTNGYNMVVLINEELKDYQWTFSRNPEARFKEIFGQDVFEYMDGHESEIKAALKTIKKLV